MSGWGCSRDVGGQGRGSLGTRLGGHVRLELQ